MVPPIFGLPMHVQADVAKILDVAETYQEFLFDAWEAYFGEEE